MKLKGKDKAKVRDMKRKMGLTEPALFDDSDVEIGTGITSIIHGPAKSGKSLTALKAPGPIVYLTCDRSYLGPYKYAKACGKDLSRVEFFWTPPKKTLSVKDTRLQLEAQGLMKTFEDSYIRALRASLKQVRSIIIDNGTLINIMCLSAIQGKVARILPRDRGASNDRMQRLYSMSQEFEGKQVIWIHRSKEEYRGENPTGNLIPEGWKHAVNEVQAVIETRRVRTKQGVEFFATITDSMYDAEAIGEEFEGDNLTYAKIASSLTKLDEDEFSDGVEL